MWSVSQNFFSQSVGWSCCELESLPGEGTGVSGDAAAGGGDVTLAARGTAAGGGGRLAGHSSGV